MIHAYDKVYLEKARTALGRMLDFAVHDLHYDMADFFNLFLSSGMAGRFEVGDFTVLAGMSGTELAYEVIDRSDRVCQQIAPYYTANRSREYWTGWALAYYQWLTALSFSDITACVPIKEIQALYEPYHQMDIRQFADKMDALYLAVRPDTNLKHRRKAAGLSQSQLAALSGVPLRTIQQYEQRQKNINKAQAEYLYMLAQTLCCPMDALLERVCARE